MAEKEKKAKNTQETDVETNKAATEGANEEQAVDPKIAELEALLKKAQDDLAHEKEMGMRVRAEYDNYRKRTAKEMGEIAIDVRVKTVQEILPIADNIERALSVTGSDADMRKGIEMIEQQILNTFAKLEIEAIADENVAFDPNIHNAVMHVEDENFGENTVVQVFQKGYKIGDKIVRYAMVKVAN